jgi:hypothetical protein
MKGLQFNLLFCFKDNFNTQPFKPIGKLKKHFEHRRASRKFKPTTKFAAQTPLGPLWRISV